MQKQSGWWWYGTDLEQAAAYKYSEEDINSTKQFSKAAVLMCVRVGEHDNDGASADHEDVPGTRLEEDVMNHDNNVTEMNIIAKEGNDGKSPQETQTSGICNIGVSSLS